VTRMQHHPATLLLLDAHKSGLMFGPTQSRSCTRNQRQLQRRLCRLHQAPSTHFQHFQQHVFLQVNKLFCSQKQLEFPLLTNDADSALCSKPRRRCQSLANICYQPRYTTNAIDGVACALPKASP
jgi:hypothetical protein